MTKHIGTIAVLACAILIAGCGNGDGTLNGSSGPTPTPTEAVLQLGTGSGSAFQPGVLGIVNPNLLAGGSTVINAALQYTDGTAFTDSATITFTSSCFQKGTASFSVAGKKTNQVATSKGQAEITYTAAGCTGADEITASTTIDGNVLHASGTVTVSALKVQFGSGSGSSFQSGVLTIAPAQLSAGNSASVSGLLQYTDGTPYTGSAIVTFTSPCFQNGLASFAVNGTAGNAVTTTTGNVKITYTANGCRGSDIVTATTSVQGEDLSAQAVVTVAAAVLLGSGSGASFQPGELLIANSQLPVGGSTDISASLQFADGTVYTGPAILSFTSPCFRNGKASFAVNGVSGNTVSANNGRAKITYTDENCNGSDVITATTTIQGSDLSAVGGVTFVTGTQTVQFGSTGGGSFLSGALGIAVAQLPAGGSTTVSGILQFTDGTPYTGSAIVTFTSPCFQNGLAGFTVGGTTGNVVTTTTGQVTITYTAKGCRGSDIITATTSVQGKGLSARGVVTVATSVLLGSGSGSSFQPGELQITNSQLPAGGSTDISASLQNADGTPYTVPVTLTFTSPCSASGKASFAVNGVPGNTVATNGGKATITYTANGCRGLDIVVAKATVEGNNLSATGGVTVAPAVQFGSGSGSSFQSGVLTVAPAQLSASGSATVSGLLQYTDGTPYTGSAIVTFTSPCFQNGLASFAVSGTASNVVTTTTGNVKITYTANGCRGSDIVTATTSVQGEDLSAQAGVTIAGAVELGSGSGDSFQSGELAIASPQISLDGSTDISASLQFTDGTPYTDAAALTFTSPCFRNGKASFAVNGVPGNTVSLNKGQARITYTAEGCSGVDVITATTVVQGASLSAEGGVNITASSVRTLQFGSVSGGAFQQAALIIAPPQLLAGGSATVSGVLQFTDGTPYTGVAIVTFTSPCFQNGLAGFTVGGTAGNVVTVTNGQVAITYTAKGCRGSDIVTATTTVQGSNLSARGVATVAASVLLGSGTGNAFQPGELQITNSQLPAGGSTNISANLQFADGTAYTGAATLTFTSPCFASGKASFAVNGVPGNTVNASNGKAAIAYTANGCTGLDVITATTTAAGDNLSAIGGLTVAPAVQFGSVSGGTFQQGVLALGLNQISAGGSTSVSANLQFTDGTPYTGSATVTFISPCFQNGQAAFLVGGNATNSVTTTTGRATITYTAKGCSGTDTITAQTMVNDQLLTATGTVTVASATIGSIQFISVNPQVISLQGAGGQTTSTVVFQVTDNSGGSVPNAHVTFTPSTTVGGIFLTPTSATTGSDGRVQTIVNAGTLHTTVRVTASTTTSGGQTISTQSSPIVISTGLATENHFSLLFNWDNPLTGKTQVAHNVEGYDLDGTQVKITATLSDRFGNPVPDGTTAAFTANGGQIQNSCATTGNPVNSQCAVTWTSANPRPTGTGGTSVIGHAEILAFTTGEESFTDANGNGVFDGVPPDIFTLYPGAPAPGDDFFGQPAYEDIGEVYLDENQNGKYDSGEFFFDFNKNNMRDPPDHTFHGIGCPDSSKPHCGNTHNFGVGIQSCIVMATSNVTISGPITLNPGDVAVEYDVADMNGNVPPAGMQFSVVFPDLKNKPDVTILEAAVPDIPGCPMPPTSYVIHVTVSKFSGSGPFRIEAKSPQTGTLSFSGLIIVN